jgi:hypothetical protein
MISVILALFIAAGPQTQDGSLRDITAGIIYELENCRVSGLHRVIIGSGGVTVSPPLQEATGAYRLLRREVRWGRIHYGTVAVLDAHQLAALTAGEVPADLRSGDLLQRLNGKPRLAVRVATEVGQPPVFAKLLESTLTAHLAATGVLEEARPLSGWGGDAGPPASYLDSVRAAISGMNVDAALNLVFATGNDRIVVLGQIIGADPSQDELFGLRFSLSPEIALLMQTGPESAGPKPGRLLLSMPMPAGVLAVGAADIDRREGDELLLLTSNELLVFRYGNSALELHRKVSLAGTTPAQYLTRSPSGRIVKADVDGDKQMELLISCNLWASGVKVDFGRRLDTVHLPIQPLAVDKLGGKINILGGDYYPGEDTFQPELSLTDERFFSSTKIVLKGVRSLLPLDTSAAGYLAHYPDGRAGIWRRSEGGRIEELKTVRFEAAASSPELAPGKIVFAERRQGGDMIAAADFASPDPPAAGILTSLEIDYIALLKLPGGRTKAIACGGKGADGAKRLEVYAWPSGFDPE